MNTGYAICTASGYNVHTQLPMAVMFFINLTKVEFNLVI